MLCYQYPMLQLKPTPKLPRSYPDSNNPTSLSPKFAIRPNSITSSSFESIRTSSTRDGNRAKGVRSACRPPYVWTSRGQSPSANDDDDNSHTQDARKGACVGIATLAVHPAVSAVRTGVSCVAHTNTRISYTGGCCGGEENHLQRIHTQIRLAAALL